MKRRVNHHRIDHRGLCVEEDLDLLEPDSMLRLCC